jgi:hypothetical protein
MVIRNGDIQPIFPRDRQQLMLGRLLLINAGVVEEWGS